MAPKNLLQEPPPATSSTEEEEDNDAVEIKERKRAVEEEEKSEDEDDEDDDDEEEKSKSSVKKPNGAASTTAQPGSDSDSGSESDYGSDQTQPSPTASAFIIKPISSRSMYDSATPKKSGPMPTTVSASAISISKRPAESSPNSKDSKKKKLVNGDDGTGNQRLWGEDDEIEILRGMTEYQLKKGSDPHADMGAFHEFIKKSLHVDVSKNQVKDKISRLKKKYQLNAERGENGEDPVFSKQHELQSFELSKKIWGPEANGKSKTNARKSGKAANNKNETPAVTMALPKQDEDVKEVVMMDSEVKKDMLNGGVKKKADPDDFWTKYPHLSRSFTSVPEFGGSFMRERMSVIGNEKANDLDEKWRKLQMKAFELYLRRIELVEEQGKLLLDALKKSMD